MKKKIITYSMRSILALTIIVFCIACDQVTKLVAKHYLATAQPINVLGDTVRLLYVENTGAFFSIGDRLPEQTRLVLFTVAVGLVLLCVAIYVLFAKTINLTSIVGLALISGGGLSNLLDRFLNNGAVIDFMNFGIGALRTGVFNIADLFIAAGIVMLFFDRSLHKK